MFFLKVADDSGTTVSKFTLTHKVTKEHMLNLFSNNIEIAEDEILRLADFIYAHTNIKPMSKVIYLISRLLLLSKDIKIIDDAIYEYNNIARSLEIEQHGADYSLSNILHSAHDDFTYIFSIICRIKELTQGRDSLGIVFDTLLRGKYESGEGLGTFLTPEEVVSPSLDLCLHFLKQSGVSGNAGDLCGGTGRFMHTLYKKSAGRGFKKFIVADQSAFSIELARINFHIESVANADFYFVADSITDGKLKNLNSSFSIIATNPPFGTGKYSWSSKISNVFKSEFLHNIGFSHSSAKIDPAEIFVYRNLLFLMEGGILGIVLPDGVAIGDRLATGIKYFEKFYNCTIAKLASISLPASTFSLGGTVAKTSFVIFKKEPPGCKLNGTYHGLVHHIGFLKKGNRRVVDPNGNEYEAISRDIIVGKIKPIINSGASKPLNGAIPLNEFVYLKREYPDNGFKADYHISILDVDETGYIEFRTVLSNSPTTKPLLCQPGDILVSCINPRIWRVTIIPDIPGTWSCSSEFAVLRPIKDTDTITVFTALLSKEFNQQVVLLAKGTSSSRQRIKKESLLTLRINKMPVPSDIEAAITKRISFYKARLAELKLFLGDSTSLHKPDCKTAGL
jgi:type I restriction-modification system DNA methylase subunit